MTEIFLVRNRTLSNKARFHLMNQWLFTWKLLILARQQLSTSHDHRYLFTLHNNVKNNAICDTCSILLLQAACQRKIKHTERKEMRRL